VSGLSTQGGSYGAFEIMERGCVADQPQQCGRAPGETALHPNAQKKF